MKIYVGLVTPDAALRSSLGINKASVVPPGTLSLPFYKDRKPQVVAGSYVPHDLPSKEDFEEFLFSRAVDCDVCILLIDRRWEYLAADVQSAVLAAVFDNPGIENPKNFFHKLTGALLKSYMRLAKYFDDHLTYEILCLPIRNFCARELSNLVALCRDRCIDYAFHNELQNTVAKLTDRRRPRRRSSYKTIYVVDEKERFFVLGSELHAHFDTGHPHRISCAINGFFRFGRRIDERRHYNVSETERDRTIVDGVFVDCHGTAKHVSPATHLNMFSNDFF